MRLIYVDESGNTGARLDDPQQPILVLASLIIEPEKIRSVEKAISDIAEKYFGPQARDTDFEFHGAELYQRKGRYFGDLKLEKSLSIFSELYNFIKDNASIIAVAYVSIDKRKYYGKAHIQQTAFTLLLERLEPYLQQKDSYGLLICDENQEMEQLLIDDLDRYKHVGTDLGNTITPISRIVDSVHFVKSKNNNLMQLCDVIGYIIYRGKLGLADLKTQYEKSTLCGTMNFDGWLETEEPHKAKRYFYKRYKELSFLFKRDFP